MKSTGVRGANRPAEVAQTVNEDWRGLRIWVEGRQGKGGSRRKTGRVGVKV